MNVTIASKADETDPPGPFHKVIVQGNRFAADTDAHKRQMEFITNRPYESAEEFLLERALKEAREPKPEPLNKALMDQRYLANTYRHWIEELARRPTIAGNGDVNLIIAARWLLCHTEPESFPDTLSSEWAND